MNQMRKKSGFNYWRGCGMLLVGYIMLVVLLYFLMGHQLHYRESQGAIPMVVPDSSTVELEEGAVVEETFSVYMHRITSIGVQWGAYYRDTNSGNAHIELYNLRTRELLLSQTFDVSVFTESYITTVTADQPLDGVYNVPLLLRITADSPCGAAVTPLMSAHGAADANADLDLERTPFSLTIDGHPSEGILSFSVSGEDYTWVGQHYWHLTSVVGILLATYLLRFCYQEKMGKSTFLQCALTAFERYRFLIKQLVMRDFKSKYKRSILGVFWSFLNPFLNMLVQYVVFSNVFRFNIAYFPVYLLCGNVIFNYVSESCGMALMSIVGNQSLITKVYIPKYIYPLTRIMSSLVNLTISLIPLLAVTLLSGLPITRAFFLVPVPLLCLAIFCLGLGLLLSAAMVFFRDIQFLWGVVTTIWMYLTPIFYPISVLPSEIQAVVKLNPLYFYLTFIRSCLIDGVSPDPRLYLQCVTAAAVMLVIGSFVFKKTQNQFVLYL